MVSCVISRSAMDGRLAIVAGVVVPFGLRIGDKPATITASKSNAPVRVIRRCRFRRPAAISISDDEDVEGCGEDVWTDTSSLEVI